MGDDTYGVEAMELGEDQVHISDGKRESQCDENRGLEDNVSKCVYLNLNN